MVGPRLGDGVIEESVGSKLDDEPEGLVGYCKLLNVVEEVGVVEVFAERLTGISGARLK